MGNKKREKQKETPGWKIKIILPILRLQKENRDAFNLSMPYFYFSSTPVVAFPIMQIIYLQQKEYLKQLFQKKVKYNKFQPMHINMLNSSINTPVEPHKAKRCI